MSTEDGRLINQLSRLKPKTLGEKMLATAVSLDLGAIAISSILTMTQKEGITAITPDTIQAIHNVLFWGVHIVISDAFLKIGGTFHMIFREEENWLKKKATNREVVRIQSKYLQIDGSEEDLIPYIENKHVLNFPLVQSPQFWNLAISCAYKVSPDFETRMSQEYNLRGQQLKSYLVERQLKIIEANKQFASGTLNADVVIR